jgi:hypothetical protein
MNDDTVPRSRYDACNADWLREKERADKYLARLGVACYALDYALNCMKSHHMTKPGISALVTRVEQIVREGVKP